MIKYILDHPNEFCINSLQKKTDTSFYNLTVDTLADFQFVTEIFETLGADGQYFGVADVETYLATLPDIPDCAYT